jgi:two-component system sensor histidine kinase ResE
VHTSFTGQAEAAGIDLSLEVDDTHPSLTIRGDYGRLDQVFSNLIVNALRHTPEGGRIQFSVKPQVTEVEVSVSDNGQGISQEDLPYIFDRFWRGDRSRTRSPGSGSGLGLAIARQLVQAHGGQISVKSQPGMGTTFNIRFPKNQAEAFSEAK